MAPRIVYRFETRASREGPWTAGYGECGWMLDARAMPGGYVDKMIHYNNWHYGFVPGQHIKWFTKRDRQILRHRGFVLSTYMVPVSRVETGVHQAVFDIDAAIRVKEQPPTVRDRGTMVWQWRAV